MNMSWLPFVALVPPPTITCVTLLPLTLPFATLVGAEVVEMKMKVQRRSLGQTCFQCESLACCLVSGQSFTLKVVTRTIAGCQNKKLLLQPGKPRQQENSKFQSKNGPWQTLLEDELIAPTGNMPASLLYPVLPCSALLNFTIVQFLKGEVEQARAGHCQLLGRTWRWASVPSPHSCNK